MLVKSTQWNTALKIISLLFSWALIGLYVFFIYKSYKKPSKRVYGVLILVLGMLAIPSFFSISSVREVITDLFPCSLQSAVDSLVTEWVIPLTALISLL